MKKPIKNDKKIKGYAGRPPISPERVTKLEQGFKNGLNITESCLFAGVARQTYYRNVKENEEFSDKMEYSQKIVLIRAKQNIVAKISEGEKPGMGDVELSKWWIEHRDKDFKVGSVEVNVNQEQSMSESKELEEKHAKLIEKMNQGGIAKARHLQKQLDDLKKVNNEKGICEIN